MTLGPDYHPYKWIQFRPEIRYDYATHPNFGPDYDKQRQISLAAEVLLRSNGTIRRPLFDEPSPTSTGRRPVRRGAGNLPLRNAGVGAGLPAPAGGGPSAALHRAGNAKNLGSVYSFARRIPCKQMNSSG